MSEQAQRLLSEIIRYVQQSGSVTIAEIVDQFDLSQETVRTVVAVVRDLHIDDTGMVTCER